MPQDFSKYADYLNLLAPSDPNSEPVPQTFDPAHPEAFAKYLEVLKPQPQEPQASPAETIASTPPIVRQPRPAPVLPTEPEEEKPAPVAPAPQTPLDFTGNSASSQDNLANALQTQGNLNLISNLGRAGDTIGSAIARTPNQENAVYKSIDQQAAAIPGQYKQVQENEKNDPNSQISTGFRDFVEKRLGTPLKGNPSASDLSAVIPMLFKDYEARLAEKGKLEAKKLEVGAKKEQNDARLEETKRWHDLMNETHKDRIANAQSAQEVKDENLTNSQFMKMSEKLSAARASSRSAFGKAALNKAAAERIEALVEGRSLNDLDNREIQEVARSLDSLLAQGQPTISGAHELVPKTLVGNAAGIAEYLTNQRQGAGAQSFLAQMIKTVKREKELADKQKGKYIKEMIPGYSHLEAKDPERFNTLLDGVLGQNQEATRSPQSLPADDLISTVTIRRKSDGKMVQMDAKKAKEYLQSSDFEQVK